LPHHLPPLLQVLHIVVILVWALGTAKECSNPRKDKVV